jgi:hypothetical protein
VTTAWSSIGFIQLSQSRGGRREEALAHVSWSGQETRRGCELGGSARAQFSRSAALLGNEAEPGGRGNGMEVPVGEKENNEAH